MLVNIKGLINRLDGFRERVNDLLNNLDTLEELEQEDIEIGTVQQYFQNDDTFNLSIAIDLLEQADKLDKVLEIIKEFIRIGFIKISFKERQNLEEDEIAYYVFVNGFQYRCKTEEEYNLLKEVLN